MSQQVEFQKFTDNMDVKMVTPNTQDVEPLKQEVNVEKGVSEDDWENSPENPRNWSISKKWITISMVSLYTAVSPLGSSMMAPALPQIGEHYHIHNPTILGMTLSIFLLSFAFGPLLFAPLSEMYGRTWVYHFANIVYLAFNLGCAFAPSTSAFLAFRFLVGFFASASLACGGGSVSDLFSPKERGSAMALYGLGPLLAPALGPIAGGFITETIGFRYIFIVMAGLCALAGIIALPLLRETYEPVLKFRRLKRTNPELAAKAHPVYEHGSKWRYLWVNLTRPLILLSRSSICFMLSLYLAFMYGIYYIMFTTFSDFFETTYGFSAGISGLTFLGIGIGFASASFIGARLSDLFYRNLSKNSESGTGTPEMRIPLLILGSIFVPIGVFWYGWSAQAKLQWIMPIIGTFIFGLAFTINSIAIQLYLVDTFKYAASAVAAASTLRSLFGFAFPLFGARLYDALGLGGGNSLLAGLTIALGIPFPIWLWFYGANMRTRSTLTRR